eukprot:SAG11_NODE_4137_length_2044_cov_1.543959_2_plen_168_part_00
MQLEEGGDADDDSDHWGGSGVDPFQLYWNERCPKVVHQIQGLLACFRGRGSPVVHTRNGAVTPLGLEISPRLRAARAPGQRSTRFRGAPGYDPPSELAPLEDELVVDKLTSSAFHQTMLGPASTLPVVTTTNLGRTCLRCGCSAACWVGQITRCGTSRSRIWCSLVA